MNKAFLSIGTNLGQREENLRTAVKSIGEQAGFVRALSSVYETEPWKMAANDRFLNMAIEIETTLNPHDLLAVLLDIETKMGRDRRGAGYSSRIIDIDILFFNDYIIGDKDLVVPHPLIANRRFALEPLADIAPKLIHPRLGKTIEQLLEECADSCIVRKTGFKISSFITFSIKREFLPLSHLVF